MLTLTLNFFQTFLRERTRKFHFECEGNDTAIENDVSLTSHAESSIPKKSMFESNDKTAVASSIEQPGEMFSGSVLQLKMSKIPFTGQV
jgi:hypothetical protein